MEHLAGVEESQNDLLNKKKKESSISNILYQISDRLFHVKTQKKGRETSKKCDYLCDINATF